MLNKFDSKRRIAKINWKWILNITLFTVVICSSISLFSNWLLRRVNLLVAFVILIVIVILGTIFDIIGISVTVSEEMPFHAMASKRISEAKVAIKLIRNADKVSSICQDVVGDVCGIVSGSIGVLIAAKLEVKFPNANIILMGVVIETIIGTVTIVGKAFGKDLALKNGNRIIFKVSKLIWFIRGNK